MVTDSNACTKCFYCEAAELQTTSPEAAACCDFQMVGQQMGVVKLR